MQVGGALGVAVIGSLLSTRYQDRMTAGLAPYHLPHAIETTIRGSIGGALGVAARRRRRPRAAARPRGPRGLHQRRESRPAHRGGGRLARRVLALVAVPARPRASARQLRAAAAPEDGQARGPGRARRGGSSRRVRGGAGQDARQAGAGGPWRQTASAGTSSPGRMEAVAPVCDPVIQAELETILRTYEEDNCSAWDMQPDGGYLLRHPAAGESRRGAQEVFIKRSASS